MSFLLIYTCPQRHNCYIDFQNYSQLMSLWCIYLFVKLFPFWTVVGNSIRKESHDRYNQPVLHNEPRTTTTITTSLPRLLFFGSPRSLSLGIIYLLFFFSANASLYAEFMSRPLANQGRLLFSTMQPSSSILECSRCSSWDSLCQIPLDHFPKEGPLGPNLLRICVLYILMRTRCPLRGMLNGVATFNCVILVIYTGVIGCVVYAIL